ncbi:hypothetical protein [Entomohabitans teleogrylli]|uniref:hypothetical protein n=1 Tax=Entomohabitans teleogrylli TaxID=1384589 RepID=UPI00073D2FA5|nr:hypothetical protein [Entomohabitans teleogrylli]
MKVYSQRLLFPAVCFFFSSALYAKSDGGTIHFIGQIVEPMCNVTQNHNSMNMTCDSAGQPITWTAPVENVSDLKNKDGRISEVYSVALNGHPQSAIVTVVYR